MATLDSILAGAVQNRASDIHFSAGEKIWVRVDGDLYPFSEKALAHEQLQALFFEVLSETEKERLLEKKNLDRSYCLQGVSNFRVNLFYTRRGIGGVIRTLPSKIPTMEELGLPACVRGLTELSKGLILVTGPTGSGKSTTLAAFINHINQNFPYHVLTVEDPVEFIHSSQKSLINQREIGQSCPTFADALKYALREDPDVILVGEMRDLETIQLALTAAETGHLVLGTLHTRGAAPTVDRIIEIFPAMQQPMVRAMLAESLQAVISQALLKRAVGTGRVAVYEVMIMNHAISNLIREGKTFQIPSAIQTGKKEGMVLMESHVRDLVAAGTVAPGEANTVLVNGAKAVAVPAAPSAATVPSVTPPPIRMPVEAAATQSAAQPSPSPSSSSPPSVSPVSKQEFISFEDAQDTSLEDISQLDLENHGKPPALAESKPKTIYKPLEASIPLESPPPVPPEPPVPMSSKKRAAMPPPPPPSMTKKKAS